MLCLTMLELEKYETIVVVPSHALFQFQLDLTSQILDVLCLLNRVR